MKLNSRRLILIAGAAALLLLPLLAYAFDGALHSGEVTRNVTAAGVPLGGLGEADAVAALEEYQQSLRNTPAHFVVNNVDFALNPADVDLHIDAASIVAAAMEQRRDRGLIGDFFGWFSSFGDQIDLPVPVTIDTDKLDDVLKTWEDKAIDTPAYEGGIIVRDGRVLPDYPRPGEGIDRTYAEQVISETLQRPERATETLATRQIEPDLTDADIDAATVEAAKLIDAPVTLTAADPPVEITFTPEELAAALLADVRTGSQTELVLEFDVNQISQVLASHRGEIEQPPRDAEWIIDEEAKEVTLNPSRPQTLIDPVQVAARLREVADDPDNSGAFPFGYGTAPAFTTADAQALGDVQFVSEFTTSHPAGQPRVTNIHTIADAIDGAMVMPGDEFSINEYVGQRTAEKGYVSAPMILGGELVDDIGGGVSQFATTFYNAVFYGCYEDVEHKPHSYYFTRYPEVNEATISWPSPNLIFRNNTDAVVIIKTQYTATDITVQFYGDNGGCQVERVLGDRHGFTDPPVEYEPNPDLTPDDEKVVQRGTGGFSNSVTRVMTWPDGTKVEQPYTWTYRAEPRILEVHPCNVPPEDGAEPPVCPIKVPSVIGGSFDSAKAALEGAGFAVANGPTIQIDNEASDGLIVTQSPSAGEWVAPGTTITINVGVYVPPEQPPGDGGGDSG